MNVVSSWQFILDNLPALLAAAVDTIKLTVPIVIFSTILAVPLVILRSSSNPLISLPVAIYSWIMRVTPLLVVLYFVFYGLPILGVRIRPFTIAVVGSSILSASYYMEVIRGGLLAVPQGQLEAARALGLSSWRIWQRIVLPQVIPVSLPPYISNTVLILKGTSIAMLITVDELTGVGFGIISVTYRPMEIILVMAIIYLAMITAITSFQHWAERRWAIV